MEYKMNILKKDFTMEVKDFTIDGSVVGALQYTKEVLKDNDDIISITLLQKDDTYIINYCK